MRVLQIAGARTPGGLLTHVEHLTRGLIACGHQLDVMVSPAPGVEPVAARVAATGATVHRLEVRGKTDLSASRALKRRVAAVHPDIVHLHLSSPVEASAALLAARRAGSHRMVTTEHAPKHAPLRRFYSATLKRALGRSLDRVIAVCRFDADYLVQEFGLRPESITVIHNGTPGREEPLPSRDKARRLLGLNQESFVVGYAGGLSVEKGVADLMDAATSAGIPDLIVVLAGDGPLRADLEAQQEQFPFRLVLLGQLPGIDPMLACLDAFVLPSRSESMPLALLEAMHAGLPVISTRVGGIPEAVENDVNGLLIQPGEPAELATALHALWSDPSNAERMGIQAGAIARKRFSARHMVSQVEELYRQLLEPNA